MNATVIDQKRRLVMPPEFKPRSAVTVQMIDAETVLIKLARPAKNRMVLLLPDVKHLPDDPEWDKVEAAFARASNRGLTPPEA